MITKTARLVLIASICAKLGTAQRVNAVLSPSIHDIREETTLAREREDGKLHDDDLPELPSSLPFDMDTRADESDVILSAKERKAVAHELTRYRIAQDLSRPVNPFALAIA